MKHTFALALLLAAPPAAARTVTVSNDSQLRSAIRGAQAGDVIELQPGSYSGGHVLKARNVTLKARSGRPRLTAPGSVNHVLQVDPDASGARIQGLELVGGRYYGVKLNGVAGASLESLIIRETGENSVKGVTGTRDIVISGCDFSRAGRRNSRNQTLVDFVGSVNVTVKGSRLHDSGTHGGFFKGGSQKCLWEGNTVEKCGGAGLLLGYFTDRKYVLTAGNPRRFEALNCAARGNQVRNCGQEGVGIYSGQGCVVEGNTLERTATTNHKPLYFSVGGADFRAPISEGCRVAGNRDGSGRALAPSYTGSTHKGPVKVQ